MRTYYLAKAALCREMAQHPSLERSAATLKRMADRFERLGAAVPDQAGRVEAAGPEPES